MWFALAKYPEGDGWRWRLMFWDQASRLLRWPFGVLGYDKDLPDSRRYHNAGTPGTPTTDARDSMESGGLIESDGD
jgi:hypothetical protein